MAPVFSEPVYSTSVNESAMPPFAVLKVTATDSDFGGNGSLVYSLQMPGTVPFGVSPSSGEVYVSQQLDRETADSYRFVVLASDGNQTGQSTVEIDITDTNDNPPIFTMSVFTFNLEERDYSTFSDVGVVNATDPDDGVNALVRYSLLTNTTLFKINPSSGKIEVEGDIDREKKDFYVLRILATDQGFPQLNSTCMVQINITDINDNAPRFVQPPDRMKAIVSIDEDAGIGTVLFTAKAEDDDSGSNARISFYWDSSPSALFSLNDTSGVITTIAPLDYEANQQLTLRINATDGGPTRLSSFAHIEVRIRDVNDEPPVFVNTSGLTLSFVEDHAVNTELATIVAVDRESVLNGNGLVQYSILSQDTLILKMFSIGVNNGKIMLLKPFNFTSTKNYQLTIQASDAPGGRGTPLTANYTVKFEVLKDIDTGPYFRAPVRTVDVPENATAGTNLVKVTAVDR